MNGSEFLSGLLSHVIPLAIQSTLLLWFVFGGVLLLRKRGAAAESLLYRAALVGLVTLVVISVAGMWRYSGLTRIPSPPLEATIPLPLPEPTPSLAVVHSTPMAQVLPPVTREDQVTVGSVSAWIFAVWEGVTTLLLLWMFGCYLVLRRLRRNAVSVEREETHALLTELATQMQVRRPLLLTGDWVKSPFLDGLGEPAILLPRTYWTDFSDEALRAVLAHELAHLRRADCWWNLAARVVCAVGWMHPLVWSLRRRMEHVAEEACDQEVLQVGCSARDYALCLTDLAERMLPTAPVRTLGSTVVPFRSGLGKRVKRLFVLAGTRQKTLGRVGRFCVGLGALASVAMAVRTVSAMPELAPDGSQPVSNPGTLSGKVVYEDGRPAGGLKVFAAKTSPSNTVAGSIGIGKTQADGTYRIGSLGGGEFIVYPVKPPAEWTAAAVRATLREGETVKLPDMALVSGGLIQGRVVDDSGVPMEGVHVSIDNADHPEPSYPNGNRKVFLDGTIQYRFSPGGTVKTNQEGHFQLRASPGKSTLWVTGPTDWSQVAKGSAPKVRKTEVTVVAGKSMGVELRADSTLYACGLLTGRVVFEDGRPATGIRVLAQQHSDRYQLVNSRNAHGGDSAYSWSEDVTKPDGSYRLTGLVSGPYNVLVDDPAREWVAPAPERKWVKLREALPLPDVVLTHGALVTGTVTDEATGQPLAGVSIGSYGAHRPSTSGAISSAPSGADGRYRLHVAPGASEIYVADMRYGKGLHAKVTLAEGATAEIPFRVKAVPPDQE